MNNDTTHCIYRIVCFPTGKCYIGQTNNANSRKITHFRELKNGAHYNKYLQYAFNKYGIRSFYFEIIEPALTPFQVNEREIYWIEHFSENGGVYNLASGGFGGNSNFKPIVWNGVEYESVTAAAKANGVLTPCMSTRISKGYTSDDDMVGKGNARPNRKTCTWNGIEYQSIIEAAKANKFNRNTMRKYVMKGYEQDSDIVKAGGYGAKVVIWNGIEYPSLSEAARQNKVSKGALAERLAKGYKFDSDLTRQITWDTNPSSKQITWNGITYKSITAAARACEIDVSSMKDRLRRGYTCDDDLKSRPKR